MIVRPKEDLVETAGFSRPTRTLNCTQYYFVYAINRNWRGVRYFILDDTMHYFPIDYDSRLFDVVRSSIPTNWKSRKRGFGPFRREFTSFSHWVNSLDLPYGSDFYSKLIDSDLDDPEAKLFLKWVDEFEPVKLKVNDEGFIKALTEVIDQFAPEQRWFCERLQSGEPVSLRRAIFVRDALDLVYRHGLDNRGGERVPGIYKVGGVVADLDATFARPESPMISSGE